MTFSRFYFALAMLGMVFLVMANTFKNPSDVRETNYWLFCIFFILCGIYEELVRRK